MAGPASFQKATVLCSGGYNWPTGKTQPFVTCVFSELTSNNVALYYICGFPFLFVYGMLVLYLHFLFVFDVLRSKCKETHNILATPMLQV